MDIHGPCSCRDYIPPYTHYSYGHLLVTTGYFIGIIHEPFLWGDYYPIQYLSHSYRIHIPFILLVLITGKTPVITLLNPIK